MKWLKTNFNPIIYILVIGAIACKSPATQNVSPSSDVLKKIKFDLNQIDENGLIGPPDGKRSVAYEFCIPFDESKRNQVFSLDSSVQFYKGSKGRIGCSDNEYLCIGEGASKEVLMKLAGLDYVKRIDPFYGE